MRPARKFEKAKMPSPAEATTLIKKVCERPNVRLADLSVNDMVRFGGVGSSIWLTGSSVWLPASFGEMPARDVDLDIVFEDPAALQVFCRRVLETLNCKMLGVISIKEFPVGFKGFTVVENKLGGARILHPDGNGVIDMWHLAENQSIAELVSDYPGETYIRCAWHLTSAPSVGSLLRLAREDVSFDKVMNAEKMSSGYPGRGRIVPMKPGLLSDILRA